MNVVLLGSARRMTPEVAVSTRAQLGLDDRTDVDIVLVTVQRPARGLPGIHTLVVGSGVRARRRALRMPAGPMADADPGAVETPHVKAPAGAAGPTTPSDLPRGGAHRVVHAVRWRGRRARRAVATHPVVKRVSASTKVRRARSVVAPLGSAGAYALGAMVSGEVQSLVARADVVVALDADTYRAAWLLARRHPGPEVVAGAAAGKQAVARRLEG